MKFNHYINIYNIEDANKLCLILNSYDFYTKGQIRLIKEQALTEINNKNSVMICIENHRLSYNSISYFNYVKQHSLEKITIERVINEW